MELTLSWDLFIIIFFAIIMAYSFIVGRTQTMKIILCSYLSILLADGGVNLIQSNVADISPIIQLLVKYAGEESFIVAKVMFFVIFTVLLTIKGGFDIEIDPERGFAKFATTFIFSVLSAGLIISTILMFISGFSLIAGGPVVEASTIADLKNQSELIGLMVNHYNWWFSAPAFSFLIFSLMRGRPLEQ